MEHVPRPVVDAADFAAIAASMATEDASREALIKRSRDVLKASKSAIYALHRGEEDKAAALIAQGKDEAKQLLVLLAATPQLRFGALSSALEEWAEAAIFALFLKERRIATMAELEIVNREEYLGGVMDFCGEVNRFAVLAATRRDAGAVAAAREAVDALLAQFMLIDFRNGNLRRKYDGVKYTLNKLEQITYDLSLAGLVPGGYLPKGGAREAAPPPVAASGEGGGEGGEGGEGEGGGAVDGGEGGGDGGEGGAGGGGGGRGGFRGGRGGKRGRT